MQPLAPLTRPSAKLGAWLFHTAQALGRWFAGATEHHHTCKDGVALRYLRVSRPGRPIAVLVHGFSDRPESYLMMARRLPGHDLVVPALPGFHDGRAAGAPAYDVTAYARWIDELLDHLGVTSAHFVGYSLGGAAILTLAHGRPDRALSLVLLDSAGVEAPGTRSIHDEVREGHNLFEVRAPGQFRAFLQRIFHRPPPTPWPIGAFLQDDLARKADTNRAIMADLIAEGLRYEAQGAIVPLHELRARTLVVWGAHDSLFPVGVAEHCAALVPGARLEILADTGHVPHLERPWRTAALCRELWADLDG